MLIKKVLIDIRDRLIVRANCLHRDRLINSADGCDTIRQLRSVLNALDELALVEEILTDSEDILRRVHDDTDGELFSDITYTKVNLLKLKKGEA